MNEIIERYINSVDKISEKYKYPDNIKHLLYIIVPAFVVKYGIKKEEFIIECLNNIPIIITGKEEDRAQALYISQPYEANEIKTKKYNLLNKYKNISLMQLLDNLIHELNHAINSYKNEIIIENETFHLRTGLSKTTYNKNTMKITIKDITQQTTGRYSICTTCVEWCEVLGASVLLIEKW